MSTVDVKEWMAEVGKLFEKHQYPSYLVFNMDETMVNPGKNKYKVIVRATGKQPTEAMQKKGEHITFAVCIAANGSHVKTAVILPLKHLPQLPPSFESYYGISGTANGWMTKETFQLWAENIFVPFVRQVRKNFNTPDQRAILFVDGHSSRLDETAIQILVENKIDVMCLLAHSSTVLQPLDLTVNGEFKRHLGAHFSDKPGETVNDRRVRLLGIAGMCLDASLNCLNITQGFAKTGLYPFSPDAPLDSNLVRNPLTQFIYPPTKKSKRGPDICGKLLTDGKIFVPHQLPQPQPLQISATLQPPPLPPPSPQQAHQTVPQITSLN